LLGFQQLNLDEKKHDAWFCRDLIKVARGLLNEAQFAQFGDDPKEEVLTFEKVLLQTIKFDFTVEHPYKYMLQYAKALKGEAQILFVVDYIFC